MEQIKIQGNVDKIYNKMAKVSNLILASVARQKPVTNEKFLEIVNEKGHKISLSYSRTLAVQQHTCITQKATRTRVHEPCLCVILTKNGKIKCNKVVPLEFLREAEEKTNLKVLTTKLLAPSVRQDKIICPAFVGRLNLTKLRNHFKSLKTQRENENLFISLGNLSCLVARQGQYLALLEGSAKLLSILMFWSSK